MYIEEVILDGFKSYASRTHIKAWDPEFTAITGLNGSGKSNILDAICFVLGISNLTHVRVNNLQELIYKRGQAGISKASVTIVFNNNDTSKSPIGYEQYKQITVTRQIMVGGRNKYIVNGHNAQQQAVTNLFQSVQLNVNNPHFLIMQGKITKVLNMKPPEILAMIEEAAGTRMFEERKEKAFKTIVKKEKKLQELLTILNEEIGPKLEKLRAEKRAYLDYQKIEIEYDRMKRLIVAHQYYSNAQFIQSNENDHSNNVRLAEKLKSELDMVLKQIPSIESEIQRLTDQLNNSGSNTSKLSSKLKQLSNDIVRMQTQADIKSSTLNEENNNLSQMKSGVSEARAALEEKTNIKQNHQAEYEQIKTNYDLQFQKVQNMEDLLQSLKTGISSKEGQGTGFMDQIRVAQGEATQAATQIQQAKIKDTHLASELEKCQRNVNNALNENQATVAKRDQAKAELDKLQSNLDSLNFQPEIEKKLVETRSAMQSQLKVLQRDYNSISSKISNLDFSYSDPHPNFDRSQVRGLVAELISLDSGNSRFSTALEICAGGRLYNVVVENESVGALLLEKGRLRKKVTIIPLNKIKPYIASDQAVNTASSIAPGKVSLALTLVGYNNDVSRALEYVFGNTFICDDPSTANLVTFNDRVKTKSVTLDGDVYDPSGTLQGGSKPQSSGILIQINEMNEIKKKISHLTKEIEYTTEQINQLNQVSSSYKVLSQKIDLKKHEITLYDKQISTSSHSNIENRIKAIIEERQTLSLQTQSLETKRKAAIQEANRLETEMNDFNSNKTSKLQDMENQLSNERSTLEKVTKTYKQAEAEYTTLQLEIEQLKADLASSEAQLSEAESNFASLQSEDQEIKKNIQEYQTQYNSMKSELQQLTAARKQEDKEIKELEELKRTRVNEEADLQVKIKKVTYSIDRSQQQEQQAQKIVQQLDSEYDWISAQKDQFGQPNTQYDFSKFDIEDCTQQLQVLEERYNLLRKKINAKVMNTIDSVEKQESTLKQMLNTIKRDKNKIEDTIHSLDDYKKEALHNTWTKVSSDFGMIFSELLPGNLSKLEPPPGQTLMDGLEVRVNLGGVWKHSLTELSGGQRSLIALSLILSLLQFKPAPMYILDEIDAALDLSHTQNIGQLLRTRFKGSQFIVVSLKDGMFNNANVLFKARFKDGISVVERNSQNRSDKNKSR